MRKLFTLIASFAVCAWVCASTTFTFEGTATTTEAVSVTSDGITVSFSQGSNNTAPTYYSNGLRLYANNVVTVSGSNLTSIKLTCAKQGDKKDYATMTSNPAGLVSGGTSTSSTDAKTDTWTGSAQSVAFTVGASGQRLLLSIEVDGEGGEGGNNGGGDNGQGGSGEGGEGGQQGNTDNQLDPEYEYDEPAYVEYSGDSLNAVPYEFVEDNILVSCTKGAVNSQYFSVHAGNSITFTATQPMKALAVTGYIKANFTATSTAGEIEYLESEEETEGEPVLIINDINATTVTISCVKQLRCYYVEVYFDEDAEVELDEDGEDGELDYSYEPEDVTTFNIEMDTAVYEIVLNEPEYPVGIVDVYLESEEQLIDMYLYVSTDNLNAGNIVPAGTYTISDSGDAGTVAASPGGDDEWDYPSYMATDFSMLGYSAAYYFMSGSVVVEKTAEGAWHIVINATSYYGSTIHAEYTGSLDEYVDEDIEDAFETVPITEQAVKRIENGQMVIIRNGARYNAAGMRM